MRPSARQIAAFTQAARARSFSRAAAALGVTQSSITQHVARLEATIGAQLFIRRRAGLELTRAGRELFELTDRLQTLEELVIERIASYGALEGGHLRVIANAPRPVMPAIARFNAAHPDVAVTLELHDWTRAMALLRDRSVDVGVITEPERRDGLWIREIERTRYAAHMRREHRLASAASVGLADLAHETVLLPEDGSFTQRIVAAKLDASGMSFRRTLQTRTFPLIKEGVLHGLGVGVMLRDSTYPSTQLCERPIRELPETFANCLVTHVEKQDLRLVRRFVEIAEDVAAERSGGRDEV